MVTRKPCKNALCFGPSWWYLKKELGDPHFLMLESDQQTKIKLSAKFQKILEWIQSHLIFLFFKVALNPLHRIF